MINEFDAKWEDFKVNDEEVEKLRREYDSYGKLEDIELF